MPNFSILRNPGIEVWKKVVDWVYKYEHWFFAYDDYMMWMKAFGNDGFALYTAHDGEKGDPVGSVALVKYRSKLNSSNVTEIGMYFVHPNYRGTGIGSALFDKLIDECKREGGNMALNAVQNMSAKYATRYGINKFNEWHPTPVTIAAKNIDLSALETDSNLKMLSMKEVKMEQLLDYDYTIVGIHRHEYLRELLNHVDAFHRIAVEDGKIVGLINARKVIDNSLSVGPFYADNKLIASSLLCALFKWIDNIGKYSQVLLSIPTTNQNGFSITDKLSNSNYEKHDYLVSQFSSDVIETKKDSIYGITEYAFSHA